MTVDEVMKELESMGTEQTRKTFARHGGPKEMFGVRVGDMKKIVKKTRMNQELARELYATGNSDAMYLAGLIAEPEKMTKKELKEWVNAATWFMISEYTVAWVAAESRFGWDLGLEWIESKKEKVACSGWCTLGSVIGIRPNSELDVKTVARLLQRVVKEIHEVTDRVRLNMNSFVICVGTYIPELHDAAAEAGRKIGKVSVDMGDTACKVPDIVTYLKKVKDMGRVGKKRKGARC